MTTKTIAVNGFLVVILFGMVCAADTNQQQTVAASGWPNWRGASHNGISSGQLATWPKEGPKQLWKV